MSREYPQEYWKKQDEMEALGYFLDEYTSITGRALALRDVAESPDFICVDAAGVEVGVELVRAMQDPEGLMWRRILDKLDNADGLETWIRAQDAVYKKEEQRKKAHWRLPEATILVVQLMDCPIDDVEIFIEDDLRDECAATGFAEIWLADFTAVEPFGTVQLYGIKPNKIRGLHEMQHPRSWEPYG